MSEAMKPARRKSIWRWVGPALILTAAVAGVVVVVLLPPRDKTQEVTPPEPMAVGVETVTAVASLHDTVELDGSVEPQWVVNVAAEVSGRVERYATIASCPARPLKEGDPIAAGALILYLNKDLLEAEFQRAFEQHEFDQRDLKRVEQAVARNVATPMQLDEAKTRERISGAILADIRARLDRTTIRSPVAGVLNKLPVEVGEYVQPGTPVAQVVNTDTMKVVVDVPEKDIPFLRLGDEVQIFDHIGGPQLAVGKITYISKLADDLALTTRVEIEVSNEDKNLYDGQIVAVRLHRQDIPDAILIPLRAVIPLEAGYLVYVIEDGKVAKRRVEIDVVLVTGGELQVGDVLIVDDPRQVGPDQQVEVVETTTPPASRPAATASATGSAPASGVK